MKTFFKTPQCVLKSAVKIGYCAGINGIGYFFIISMRNAACNAGNSITVAANGNGFAAVSYTHLKHAVGRNFTRLI